MRRLVWLKDCIHGYQSCSFSDCTGGEMENVGCPDCGAPIIDRIWVNDQREDRGLERGVDVSCSACNWYRRRFFVEERSERGV